MSSTNENFDPRLLMDIKWDPTPTEDEILVNFLWRLNERAEETGNEDAILRPGDDADILLFFGNHANEMSVKVGYTQVPVGHYSARLGDYVVYPEHLLVGEATELQRIGNHRRVDAIASFNGLSSSATRLSQDHVEIIALLQEQDHVLRETGLASSIMTGQRMKVSADNGVFFDDFTEMSVVLDGPRDNNIYLRLLGAFTEKGGLVKRVSTKEVLIAKRDLSAPVEFFTPEEGMVDHEELGAILELITRLREVKGRHPNFSPRLLGLTINPKAA